MVKLNSYHYEGPIQLGSVIAHHCGAAGLFSNKETYDVLLLGSEANGQYTLRLYLASREAIVLTEVADTTGRSRLGKAVLAWLLKVQGITKPRPWGSLVGVRPTKLYHKACDKGWEESTIDTFFAEEHGVSLEKIRLLRQIGSLQRPYLERVAAEERHISIYGGIPFCQTRCTYCSFPYGLIQEYGALADFLQAYQRDIAHMKHCVDTYGLTVDTLYMGGGTPTSLSEDDFDFVLAPLGKLIEAGREFTVEAGRPDSVTPKKLATMVANGVTRISINPQTMQDATLKRIARGHKAEDIKSLYEYVKKYTAFTVNMDFIAGLPGQTLADMDENLRYIATAMPENVTLHTLTLKKGSPLYEGVGRELLPEEEAVREMVARGYDSLTRLGYIPYYLYRQQYMRGQMENIGFALPGHICEYNIQMMEERQSILSIGPGSSSKWMRAPAFRQKQQHIPKDIDTYIRTLPDLCTKREALCAQFWKGDYHGNSEA